MHYVNEILSQLRVSYVDLMLIHFPSGDCGNAWRVLEDLVARGRIRAIGISNFNRSSIESLMRTAKIKPALNQIRLNVLVHDDDIIESCREHGIRVEAYSPVGRGGEEDVAGSPEVQAIANKHGVSVFQVALRWIVQHDWLLTFQSASKQHQQSDADVFGFRLADKEMATLDALQDPPTPPPTLAPSTTTAKPEEPAYVAEGFLIIICIAGFMALLCVVAVVSKACNFRRPRSRKSLLAEDLGASMQPKEAPAETRVD